MIKITPKNISALLEKHYKKLNKKILKRFPTDCKFTIEEILKAKPKKLDEIVLWFEQLSSQKKEEYRYISIVGYENFSKKKQEYNAYDLAKELNIKSCPYCNRNYTFTVVKGDNEILRPDIDHFYDKDTYPITALSFYNLIPSCIECNRTLKRVQHFNIREYLHPYQDDFNTKAKFSHTLKSTNQIEINIETNDNRAENIIKALKIKEIYNEGYQDIVLELIQKREIYPDSYIDELLQKYEGILFNNREDILRLITCGYVNDADIHKRPLSKLIKDISEEIELI